MFYYTVKNSIKDQINKKYGTLTNFIEKYPEDKWTLSKMSQALNPSNNTTLETLQRILNRLGMEFKIGRALDVSPPKKAA